jgi:hypothetical protein
MLLRPRVRSFRGVRMEDDGIDSVWRVLVLLDTAGVRVDRCWPGVPFFGNIAERVQEESA